MNEIKDTPEISKKARLDCWQMREIMQGISSIQSYLASFMFRLAGQGLATCFSHICAINALNRRDINGLFAFPVD